MHTGRVSTSMSFEKQNFSHPQAETIFNSLMTVGLERQGDLKTSLSTNLTDKLRDAMYAAVADPNVDDDVSKILLQLIELQASEWQLSREALVYYYFK